MSLWIRVDVLIVSLLIMLMRIWVDVAVGML